MTSSAEVEPDVIDLVEMLKKKAADTEENEDRRTIVVDGCRIF